MPDPAIISPRTFDFKVFGAGHETDTLISNRGVHVPSPMVLFNFPGNAGIGGVR